MIKNIIKIILNNINNINFTFLKTCMYIFYDYYKYNFEYLTNSFYSLTSHMYEFGLIRANSKCTNLERT